MSAVPVAPQALQDPVAESIEPPSVDRELTRIIHERFCCNRGFAAATNLDAAARRPGRRARRSVGQHTVSSMPPSLVAPRACLAWRLRDFATNRHE